MSTEISKTKIDDFTKLVNSSSVKEQLQAVVGKHSDIFIASLIDLYSGDDKLQQCDQGEVIKTALKAVAMNLPINKALGLAYIYVFNNKKIMYVDGRKVEQSVPTPTFVPGYRGYIQLAQRTGQYKTINADVVYDGEIKSFDKLSGTLIIDAYSKKSDKVLGYFAYMEMTNGFSKTYFMSVDQMASYALRYAPSLPRGTKKEDLKAKAQDKDAKGLGWMNNYTAMALKTVIRQLIGKYGFMSVEMQECLSNEVKSEAADSKIEDADAEIIEESNERVIVQGAKQPSVAIPAGSQQQSVEHMPQVNHEQEQYDPGY